MKFLSSLFLALVLSVSALAPAQTFSNSNGCTSWNQVGNQFQLTSCSATPMNQTVVMQSGEIIHLVLSPGSTITIGTTSNRPWNYGCPVGFWARLRSNPDLEPTVYATPNDQAFCKSL